MFSPWDEIVPGSSCGSQLAASVAIGTFDILIDFAIIILPLPMLKTLQLPAAEKLGLTVIFGIGLLYVCPLPQHPPQRRGIC
jgi:hypothetical protein